MDHLDVSISVPSLTKQDWNFLTNLIFSCITLSYKYKSILRFAAFQIVRNCDVGNELICSDWALPAVTDNMVELEYCSGLCCHSIFKLNILIEILLRQFCPVELGCFGDPQVPKFWDPVPSFAWVVWKWKIGSYPFAKIASFRFLWN